MISTPRRERRRETADRPAGSGAHPRSARAVREGADVPAAVPARARRRPLRAALRQRRRRTPPTPPAPTAPLALLPPRRNASVAALTALALLLKLLRGATSRATPAPGRRTFHAAVRRRQGGFWSRRPARPAHEPTRRPTFARATRASFSAATSGNRVDVLLAGRARREAARLAGRRVISAAADADAADVGR